MYAPSEKKSDNSKGSLCEELQYVFLSFSQVPYDSSMEILMQNCEERIFSNDNCECESTSGL